MALPRWIRRLVSVLAAPDDADSILADLETEFAERRATDGEASARRWLTREVGASALALTARRIGQTAAQWVPVLDMSGAGRDIKGALRFARRQPGFVALAVATIALGIGANTTIFSVVNTLFLRPLPVTDPPSLVAMYTADTTYQGRLIPVSYLNFRDYREARVVSNLAAEVRLDLTVADETSAPERINAALVTANYFDVLGVSPTVGRTFAASEDEPIDAHPIIIISSVFWQRHFHSDRSVIGRVVRVNGLAYTLVGVAGPGFRGSSLFATTDAWVPMSQRTGIVGYLSRWFDARQAAMCAVFGRLASPRDFDSAAAGFSAVSTRLAASYPQQNRSRTAMLMRFNDAVLNPNQRAGIVWLSWSLTAIVGLVLALACVNVAHLLLVRAFGRRREIAIRLATGASRARLVRQLLIEALLLTATGGLLGLGFAVAGSRLLWAFKPPTVPDTLAVPFDGRVLIFTLGVSLLAGIAFGLAPALQASRGDLVTLLRTTNVTDGSRRRFSAKQTLVAAQIAISLLLLVSTGLAARSFGNALRIDPGMAATELVTMNMNPDSIGYDRPRAVAFFRHVVDEVQAIPGVRSAAFSFNRPLAGALTALFYLEGRTNPSPRDGVPVSTNAADPRFFATAGLHLLEGRNFTERDDDHAAPMIIINETLRRRYFAANESPVGTRMRFVDVPTPFEIVGVVSDATYTSIGETTPNYYYYPFLQAYGAGEVTLFVRTSVDPHAVTLQIRKAIQALDPNLPLYNLGVVSDVVTTSLWAPRAVAVLVGLFGAIGLVLATIGTYGVLSHQVHQQRREIGIRLALGATRSAILRRIVGGGMAPVAAGIVVGVVAARVCASYAASYLYGLAPMDVVTFLVMPTVLAMTALGATLLPAYRATRIDPKQVLHAE